VFIDADKDNYIHYYERVMEKVRPGGFILIDNVLWSGKVLESPKKGDRDTEVLIELNDRIHRDERVQEVLLPVRDGLFLIRKK
jgi:predicted O-methyltransferase YrrM